MNRLLHRFIVIAVCLAIAPVAWAHHSQSEYDLKGKVEVAGAVTKVEWKSPHVWVYVDVIDDKGQTVNWSFELPSPVTLMRRGWTRDSLKVGDRVSVSGAPARYDKLIHIRQAWGQARESVCAAAIAAAWGRVKGLLRQRIIGVSGKDCAARSGR